MFRAAELRLPKGKAWVCIVEGIVHSSQTQRWSETQIQSRGGGGSVGAHGGYVQAPRLTSSVTNHAVTAFWIHEPDHKKDYSIELANSSFAVADGQIVRICWSAPVGTERGDYLLARNINADVTQDLKAGEWFSWAKENGLADASIVQKLFKRGIPVAWACFLIWMIKGFWTMGDHEWAFWFAIASIPLWLIVTLVARGAVELIAGRRWRARHGAAIRAQYIKLFTA